MFGLHLRWRGQPFAMAAPRDRAPARFLTCGGRATVRQIVGIVRERFVALGGLALSEINGALNVLPPLPRAIRTARRRHGRSDR